MEKEITIQLFSIENQRGFRYQQFKISELGQLHESIPFTALANLFPKRKNKGALGWFSREGMLGVMFLKSYLGLSDEKLLERINTDWALQMFCGIQLGSNERIKDKDIIWRIRKYIGEHLDIDSFQLVLAKYWKPFMQDTQCMLCDATAYQSMVKFPTDVKLLWDCCNWVFTTMHTLCKALKVRRPRSRFIDQQLKQVNYQKTRKKTYKLTYRRKRSLLYLLNKGIGLLEGILEDYRIDEQILADGFYSRFKTIKVVLDQQQYMFDNHVSQVKDRIISLFKPYLRPIVRGKETTNVEFGMKIQMSQTDGINWIDHLSFDAFNEAKYLKMSIIKHKQRFGKCSQVGVDQIFGTNENRRHMKKENIFHNLIRKGKPGKYEQQRKILRKELSKQRATSMEGSFGNEKTHYGLNRIPARNEKTEIVWVFFGVMTANALKISKKRLDFKKAA